LSKSAAFDGTNYLVGIQGDATDHTNVTAQFVSQSGTLVGTRISTGRKGGAPVVGFNGTTYLMAWEDEATNGVYGQIISKAGAALTQPFAINTSTGPMRMGGHNTIFCDTAGGVCGVMWHNNSTKALYGRDIDSTGAFKSDEYYIEDPQNKCLPSSTTCIGGPAGMAVDTNGNGMGVYDTGADVRASIHGPTINVNTFLVATKKCGDATWVGIVFDGTNYLVVWNDRNDCANSSSWDVLAQQIDTSGKLVGAAFSVNSANSAHRVSLPAVAFDGTNYLITWSDGRNDSGKGTGNDVYGQYVSKTGTLVGSEIPINIDAGNQYGWVTGFKTGKYFILINDTSADPFDASLGDVYGAFVTP
jgi:hypothetical protein